MLSVRHSSVLRKRKELRWPVVPVLFLAFSMVIAQCGAQQRGLLSYRTPSYVECNSPHYTVFAAEPNVVVTVLRTGEFRQLCSVRFKTEDDTARAGVDYAATEGLLLFQAGQSIETVSVSIHPRPDLVGEKTFRLEFSTTNPKVVLTRSSVTVTIVAPDPVSDPPHLNVARGEGGQIVVSWAPTIETYVLERSPSALPGTWQPVGAIPVRNENAWTLTDSCTEPSCFYRLRKKARE